MKQMLAAVALLVVLLGIGAMFGDYEILAVRKNNEEHSEMLKLMKKYNINDVSMRQEQARFAKSHPMLAG